MPNGPAKPPPMRWREVPQLTGATWHCEPYRIDYSAKHGLYMASVLHPGGYQQVLGLSPNLISAKLKCRIHAKGRRVSGGHNS